MPSDPDAPKPAPKPPSARRKPTGRSELAYPIDDLEDLPAPPPGAYDDDFTDLPPPPAPARRGATETNPPTPHSQDDGVAPAEADPKAHAPQQKKTDAKKPRDSKPQVKRAPAKKPTDKKPAGTKPQKPAAKKPGAKKPQVKKPAAKKAPANKPQDNNPQDNKPAGTKPQKPAAKKPSGTKPQKPAATKSPAKKSLPKKPRKPEGNRTASTSAGTRSPQPRSDQPETPRAPTSERATTAPRAGQRPSGDKPTARVSPTRDANKPPRKQPGASSAKAQARQKPQAKESSRTRNADQPNRAPNDGGAASGDGRPSRTGDGAAKPRSRTDTGNRSRQTAEARKAGAPPAPVKPQTRAQPQPSGKTQEPESGRPAAARQRGNTEPRRPGTRTAPAPQPVPAPIPQSIPPNDVHFPVILGIAGLTALLALFQNLTPVGHPFWDAFLTMGFVFCVVVAGSRAVRDALLGLALVAFVFVGFNWWMVPAAAALGVVIWMMQSSVKRPRAMQRMIRSAITGVAMLPLLNLPGLGFTGSASLLVALAVIPVLYTGYQAAPAFVRSRVRRGVAGLAAFVALASVLSLIAALAGRPAAEVAIQRANNGLEAARLGEQEEAVALLEEAQGHFETAGSRFGAWWASPARLVPILAQNSRALEVAADQGAALTSAAVRATTTADVDQLRGSGGQIDIPIVRQVGAELDLTATTLNGAISRLAKARSVWLVPLIDERMESANVDLLDAAGDINLAAEAAAVLPGLLGADGARTYLVIFTNPAESREFGGFGGAYALLEAVDGKVSLLDSGRGGDLDPPAHPVIERPGLNNPELYPSLYLDFGRDGLANYFGNLTGTVDFPTIARAARDIMPRKGQPEIDGLMIMDPFALAAVMELINRPVRIDGLDAPLTSANVADFLLRDQYVDGLTTNEREDLLGAIAEQAFDSLLSINTPGPERLGEVFGPVARQKRMQFTTFNATENAFLQRIYLLSRLPTLPDTIDYLAVVGDTAAPNKLDAYLRREIVYDVAVNPVTGRFDGTVTITLHNDAPTGLPEYVQGSEDYYYDLQPGTQRERVSVYSSNDVFGFVLHDGVQSDSNEFFVEYGLNRRLTFIDIPQQSSRTITMSVIGTAAPGAYTIYMAAQPRVIDDSVVLNITPAPGWVVAHSGESSFSTSFALVEDTVLGVEFTQS